MRPPRADAVHQPPPQARPRPAAPALRPLLTHVLRQPPRPARPQQAPPWAPTALLQAQPQGWRGLHAAEVPSRRPTPAARAPGWGRAPAAPAAQVRLPVGPAGQVELLAALLTKAQRCENPAHEAVERASTAATFPTWVCAWWGCLPAGRGAPSCRGLLGQHRRQRSRRRPHAVGRTWRGHLPIPASRRRQACRKPVTERNTTVKQHVLHEQGHAWRAHPERRRPHATIARRRRHPRHAHPGRRAHHVWHYVGPRRHHVVPRLRWMPGSPIQARRRPAIGAWRRSHGPWRASRQTGRRPGLGRGRYGRPMLRLRYKLLAWLRCLLLGRCWPGRC